MRTSLATPDGIAFNEHYTGDDVIIFKHACALCCEGTVSKRLVVASGEARIGRPLQLSPARPRRTGGQGGQRNPSGYMPLDDSGMVQDESGGAAGGVGGASKDSQWPP